MVVQFVVVAPELSCLLGSQQGDIAREEEVEEDALQIVVMSVVMSAETEDISHAIVVVDDAAGNLHSFSLRNIFRMKKDNLMSHIHVMMTE